MKYTRTKECETCPLQHDSLCQKTYKISHFFGYPEVYFLSGGLKKWDELYKERTAIERVDEYLKEYFGLNYIRQRIGTKAKLHHKY